MTTPLRLAALLAPLLAASALSAQVIYSENFNAMPDLSQPAGWDMRDDTASYIVHNVETYDYSPYLSFAIGQAGGDVATPTINLSPYLYAGSTATVEVSFVYKTNSWTADGDGIMLGVGNAHDNILWIYGAEAATGSYGQGVPTYDGVWHSASFSLNASQSFWSFNGGFLNPSDFQIGIQNWVGANGYDHGGGRPPYIGVDNLSVSVASAVPEPSTYAMFAGVIALGLAVWRRQRTA